MRCTCLLSAENEPDNRTLRFSAPGALFYTSYLVAEAGRIGVFVANMAIISIMMVAATLLIYLSAALQYRGYAWADAVCAQVPDGCASPHYLAIATVIVIGIYFVGRAINKAK